MTREIDNGELPPAQRIPRQSRARAESSLAHVPEPKDPTDIPKGPTKAFRFLAATLAANRDPKSELETTEPATETSGSLTVDADKEKGPSKAFSRLKSALAEAKPTVEPKNDFASVVRAMGVLKQRIRRQSNAQTVPDSETSAVVPEPTSLPKPGIDEPKAHVSTDAAPPQRAPRQSNAQKLPPLKNASPGLKDIAGAAFAANKIKSNFEVRKTTSSEVVEGVSPITTPSLPKVAGRAVQARG